MEIRADAELPFPRALVFETYRDRLPELVPYLPNIRGIEVRSRKESPPRTELVNVWKGGGEIPAAARAFLSPNMLLWDDFATWDAEAFTCHWRTVTHSFKDALHAEGDNRFLDLGERTRIEIRGVLELDAGKVPGVPSMLARRLAPTLEQFLVALITPNLLEVSKGVEGYLKKQRAG